MDDQEGLAPSEEGGLGLGEIGFEDGLGVIAVPWQQIRRAEVGRQSRDTPEERALETIDDLVDERIAQELELLRTGGGKHRERANAVGMRRGELQGSHAPQALPEDMVFFHAVMLNQGRHHLRVGLHGVAGYVARRRAKPGQEGLDDRHLAGLGQLFAKTGPATIPRGAMQIDQDGLTSRRLLVIEAVQLGVHRNLRRQRDDLVALVIKSGHHDGRGLRHPLDGTEKGEEGREDQ